MPYIIISFSGAPSVYRTKYNDWSRAATSVLGTIECLTQNSPPTIVTWLRDGSVIELDGMAYEMVQTVIERQSYSRFNNTLLIRDAVQLAGDHKYCCRASNSAGTSTSHCVPTSWSG